jgi:hypothetical protein
MKKKDFISLYKMNRLWGDNMLEAAYWALRGKAFLTSFEGRLLEDQLTPIVSSDGTEAYEPTKPDIEDEWWQAIK